MIKRISRLVFGVLAVVALAMPAVGQDTGESCAAVADDTQRLACYDGVFRIQNGDAPADSAPEELVFSSERLIPARPSGREPATMSIACGAEGPEVRFAFANQLVSATSDISSVTLQVDQGPTQVRTMQASEDNISLTFASAGETEAFLDSILAGERLRVRMTPVRQRSVNVTFHLAEVVGPVAALRESCR